MRSAPPCRSLARACRSRTLGSPIGISGPHRRQSDQENIYFEWIESHPNLRVLLLPEEFYCCSQKSFTAPSCSRRPQKTQARGAWWWCWWWCVVVPGPECESDMVSDQAGPARV